MNEFPTTEWSQLIELNDPDHPRRRQLLDQLVHRYWAPAYHYARALRRVSADDAEDVTQQFFTMLLSRRDLERLSPTRGSFRGFLKTALRNFMTSADRAARARPQLFPFAEAEAAWSEHPDLPPDEAFDRAWARGALLDAVADLERELEAADKGVQFRIFRDYCLGEGDVTYDEVARRHGVSADDVRNRLREARARLREILRRRLREYLGPGDDVAAEIAFVLSK